MNTKTIFNQTRFVAMLLAGFLALGAALGAQDIAPSPQQDNTQAPPDSSYSDPAQQGQMNPQMSPEMQGDYQPDGNPQQDPPSRVARLSYIDGSVSFQPGGQGDWGAAVRNRPVTVGDKIWSDNNSRAELQAGQASIHISSMTALSFLNLDDQTTQMRLAEGTVNFRVRELRQGDVYEVDTPNLSFTVTQAGAFRIDVNENGDSTRVTAIRGEGEVNANGQSYTIHAGERGEFKGTDNVTYFIAAAPAPDDFDQWANGRDLREDNSVSARYVNRDVPGYSDLDDNGSWNEEPDYGPVWYPAQVDTGWAPYSDGYWSDVGPWGWTWVDYAPWGFAPYHYGRWAFIGSRWGWCPGPYYAYPVYGPAFVGFLGGGFGFGFGFGRGIGWFPLGPHEPFRPWYRVSGAYYRNVNFRNTAFRNSAFLNNRGAFNYAYAHNTRAVTVASRNNFVSGQSINRGAYHLSEANLRGAQVTNRANFSPTRQSRFGAAGLHGNISRPSAAIENRSVMARTAPAAAASHLPARSFGGVNSPGSRGGFGSASSDRPAMGRAAQTAAAANNNRPSFSQGAQGNANTSSRQRELAQDKPQSSIRASNSNPGAGGTRNWSAQGNTTDRGRAPAGFGSDSRNNGSVNRSDRPSWTQSSNGNSNRSGAGYSNNERSYSPPQRSSGAYSDGNRAYSQPRGYSAPRSYSAPSRSYSAPSRSNSAPSRSYSAPSHSSGGGGSHSGGGGSSHSSGGGGSHGGGGGGSHSSGGGSHGHR